MFVPDKFEPYEVVPQGIYNEYHLRPRLIWGMFDDRLLRTMHNIRRRYGRMVMNTWFWKGLHKERGWRYWRTSTGAPMSQHKFGRAADLVPEEYSAEDIRQDILGDPFHPDFEYITCIEMNTKWLHVDVRNYNKLHDGILLVYP